jgi:hypothetical protein
VHGENGRLSLDGEPVDAEILADSFPGVTVRRVKTALDSLLAVKILTQDADGVLRFTNWDDRNPAFPSDSAEATRERKRKSRNKNGVSTEASPDQSSNTGPAEMSRPVTPVTSRDTRDVTPLEEDIEEEREEEEERNTLPSVESRARRVVTTPTEPSTKADTSNPKPATSWPGRLAQVWTEHIGLVDPGRLGKALKPLVARHGEQLLARAIAHYGRTLLDEGRTRFASPEDFARTAAQWVDDARPVTAETLGSAP